MNEHTAVVIGASGLVGSFLLQELLNDPCFNKVRVLLRKPLPLHHPKLVQELVNFDDTSDYENKLGKGDIIFCCVGTTIKKVNGDITEYEKIDYWIPYNAARSGILKGYKKFLIISSAGANRKSKKFYLRIKGKIEEALKEFSFESTYIFRPGQLLGKRTEYRRGEQFLQSVTKFISHFLLGSLKRFHSIEARKVARAMVAAAKKDESGIHILQYREMMSLIK